MSPETSTVTWPHHGESQQVLVAGDDWLVTGLVWALPRATSGASNAGMPRFLVAEKGALGRLSDDQLHDIDHLILIDPDNHERRRAIAAKAGNRRASITVIPSAAASGAAEQALLLILALSRTLLADYSAVVDGRWSRPAPGPVLTGRTLGIIGLGRSGQALAERARGLGMRVEFYDIESQDEAVARLGVTARRFDQILADSDVISLHLPANPETFRLIDAPELAAMKPTALLVNVADGRLIDEGALIRALRNGDVGGAGLDAFAYEPLAPDSPLIGFENVVLTPGTAWMSREDEQRVWLREILKVLTNDEPGRR